MFLSSVVGRYQIPSKDRGQGHRHRSSAAMYTICSIWYEISHPRYDERGSFVPHTCESMLNSIQIFVDWYRNPTVSPSSINLLISQSSIRPKDNATWLSLERVSSDRLMTYPRNEAITPERTIDFPQKPGPWACSQTTRLPFHSPLYLCPIIQESFARLYIVLREINGRRILMAEGPRERSLLEQISHPIRQSSPSLIVLIRPVGCVGNIALNFHRNWKEICPVVVDERSPDETFPPRGKLAFISVERTCANPSRDTSANFVKMPPVSFPPSHVMKECKIEICLPWKIGRRVLAAQFAELSRIMCLSRRSDMSPGWFHVPCKWFEPLNFSLEAVSRWFWDALRKLFNDT